MKKRLSYLITILIIAVSIAGCGQNSTEQKTTTAELTATDLQTAFISETIQTPDSSAFTSIGYDADEECLSVTFRSSGSTYYYPGFSYDEWLEFKSADSLGSYFNEFIKPNYDYDKKVDGNKETTKSTSVKQTNTNASISLINNYVANKNTKKFHYDWCDSVKKMKDSNKKYYKNETRDVPIADGFKPCNNCNP